MIDSFSKIYEHFSSEAGKERNRIVLGQPFFGGIENPGLSLSKKENIRGRDNDKKCGISILKDCFKKEFGEIIGKDKIDSLFNTSIFGSGNIIRVGNLDLIAKELKTRNHWPEGTNIYSVPADSTQIFEDPITTGRDSSTLLPGNKKRGIFNRIFDRKN